MRSALAGLEWLADLFLSVGGPVQHALPELLALHAPFAARVRERIATNLATLTALIHTAPQLSLLPASAGWQAIVRMPARRSDEAWALALLERGMIVHPGHFYDLDAGEHVVLSTIVEPAALRAGCDAIPEFLRDAR